MGLTFNNKHTSELGLNIKSYRPIKTEVNDIYLDIPGRAGSVLVPGKPRDRIIPVEFGLLASSKSNLRAKTWEIATWLTTEGRENLIFDDEPDKIYKAKVEGRVDLEQLFVLGKFMVNFRCDPFAYGTEVTTPAQDDTATITNNGTVAAPFTIDAEFTAAAPEFKATLGSHYIRVVHDFGAGDTLHINTGTGLIAINGSRALDKLDWQHSLFFELAPGENILTITPVGACDVTIKHQPKYC